VSTDVKTSPDFTPTESLILDVLVARFRLGDTLWTFETRNLPALRKLEAKGLIHTNSGVTENTVRASLSNKALIENGTSWFQLSITMNQLPDVNELSDAWTKTNLEELAELPQRQCSTDARAINTAHVLLIQMINGRYPLHRVVPDEDGGVVLKREWSPETPAMTVIISRDGESFQLRKGDTSETTNNLSDALFFMSRWSK
jgi:hypothetical protein